MVERSPVSLDDFVGSFGSGAATETEPETALSTQNGDPQPQEATDAVEAEEDIQEDAPVEDELTEEEEGDVEEEPAEEEVDEAEDAADDVEDQDEVEDDEEVQEESFQWRDDLEVDVPGVGKMTLDELRRNHLREGDYTRKTQELARKEKELTSSVDAKSEALDNERQLLSQRREALEATLDVMRQEMVQGEPNWAELVTDDPSEYIRQMELKRQREERLGKIEQDVSAARAETDKIAQAKEDEIRQQEEAFVGEQQAALFDKMPDWRDQKSFGEAMSGLADLIEPYGYSLEELNNTVDHRQLVMLQGFKDAQGEIARLKVELGKTRKKASRVEKAKPALKKKVQASPKRIKPVSSAPAEPKDKAAAFLDKVKKQNGGTMTAEDFAQYSSLGGR